MNRRNQSRVALAVLLAAVSLAPASPAHAFRLGLTLFGTVGGVAMDDLNETLELLNAQFIVDMQPVRFESIDAATSWGVGLHSPFGSRLLLGAEWERLVASSDVGGPLDKNTVRANADIYRGTVAVDVIPENKFRFGFEGGFGYLSSAAEQTIFMDDVQILKTDLSGTGAAYHVSMFFGVPVTRSFDFSLGLGYRWAKLDNLGHELTTNLPPFEPLPLDSLNWTGVYGRASVTIFVI